MDNICRRCFSPLKEGQRVSVVVTATYHRLKSAIHYALDPKGMETDPETLIHAVGTDCDYDDEYQV